MQMRVKQQDPNQSHVRPIATLSALSLCRSLRQARRPGHPQMKQDAGELFEADASGLPRAVAAYAHVFYALRSVAL